MPALRLLLALWVALVAVPLAAQNFPQHDNSPVVDQADLLPTTTELDIASKSDALQKQTGRAFVVVTVSSLDGLTVEDYATQLFRKWGIGDKETDEGVLLLVAPNEKKVRIETGYGAEGFLPDILAGRIIRDSILPKFRSGDFAGGVQAGADEIIRTMSLPADAARQQADAAAQSERRREASAPSVMPAVIWGLIFVFVVLSMVRRAGGRRYRSSRTYGRGRRGGGDGISPWVILWGLNELSRASRHGRAGGWGGGFGGGGGGFGGGGFGGFGGGFSGGGGASGSW